jgi:hypothetical protein
MNMNSIQQQPILVNGGELPPINVFHNPLWMSSNRPEESNQEININKLSEMNAQLDAELTKYKKMLSSGGVNLNNFKSNNINSNENYNQGSNMNSSFLGNNINNTNNNNSNYNTNYPKFTQTNSASSLNLGLESNNNNSNSNNNLNTLRYNDYYLTNQNQNTRQEYPKLVGLEPKFLETKINFLEKESNTPLCIRREGMLKIRDADQKDKDVVVTYAVLTKDRLSYFVNPKDESSIQGSIELDKIKESLKLINGFPSCFTVKTLDAVSDCSICAESEDSAREWINSITQNAVNCNTLSALNNLNKRGLLK